MFFFSSRRRHTRWTGDWSSDVCSSDLGIDIDGEGRVRSVVTSDGTVPADVVVLGLGVRPNTALADQAGLPLGDHGGLRTDSQMRILGHDRVWAGGDCVEVQIGRAHV